MKPTKFISTQQIVTKLYRDLGMQNSIPDTDVAEWIFDIIADLKLPLMFIPKVFNNNDQSFDNYQVFIISQPKIAVNVALIVLSYCNVISFIY